MTMTFKAEARTKDANVVQACTDRGQKAKRDIVQVATPCPTQSSCDKLID